MPLIDVTQRTPEWLAARRGKVSASLAAACLGLDPYISRQKAYRMIQGEQQAINKHMQHGIDYEDNAIGAYECETGSLVEKTNLWVHDNYPWLAASPDGFVGEFGMVETKCPGTHPYGIPLSHRIQMLVQMACTGRKWCDYCTFVCNVQHGWSVQIIRLDNQPDHRVNRIINRLKKFYLEYVATKTEPPKKKRKKT